MQIDPIQPLLGEMLPMVKTAERVVPRIYKTEDGGDYVRNTHYNFVTYDYNGAEKVYSSSHIIDIKA